MFIPGEALAVIVLTAVIGVIAWLYQRNQQNHDKQVDANTAAINNKADKDEITVLWAKMNDLTDRVADKATRQELDALRENEIKQLHALLREETRAMRQDFAAQLTQGLQSIRSEIQTLSKTLTTTQGRG